MSRVTALPGFELAGYTPSALHKGDQLWVEKNCYVDVWIEVLHALGHQPLAMLPFASTIDFLGDQWTFFKPKHGEMMDLYGVDVQELTVWRPLIEHAMEHLQAGRMIATEADAFWLPDTAGTDYRRTHTKSSIVIVEVDLQTQHMVYFHNAGCFELSGEDFQRTFRIGAEPDPSFMPLFAEFIRLDSQVHLDAQTLRHMSVELWRRYVPRRPKRNPVQAFGDAFVRELPRLHELGMPYYHAWAFATVRQLGAAFELSAANCRWLAEGELGTQSVEWQEAQSHFEAIAAECKAWILKLARAVNSRRDPQLAARFDVLAEHWAQGFASVERAIG
jgi:hypothetical protein